MKVRRLPLALLAPVSLLILVVALGALQYRWVGQVSEAEREQMKQSLDRRSKEFADDFDREIGRAYQVFRPVSGFSPNAPERFVQQHDEWQTTSKFPGMIKTAYFAEQDGLSFSLRRYVPETRSFETIKWPEPLEPVRSRLTLTMPKAELPANLIMATLPVLPEVPAIVIAGAPIETTKTTPAATVMHASPTTSTFRFSLGGPASTYVVLELDRAYISSTVLPALAERHFPETERFRLSVLDGKANVMLARGLAQGQSLNPERADASAAMFGLRTETVRGVMTAFTAGSQMPKSTVMWSSKAPEPEPPTPARPPGQFGRSESLVVSRAKEANDQIQMVIEQHAATVNGGGGVSGNAVAARARSATSGWTLLLQHSAGSLDAAVARIRTRNLWLSFGILSVLAISSGLVMVNARRSEKLAAQQMDFVATVSHELRTPVAVIRSAAQNLAAGVVHEPEQARRYGDLIEAEGRRLTDMVEQVLDYAGLSDSKRVSMRRPVDAGSLVRDVVTASESLPEAERMTFEVRIDESAPAVMAEEDSIRRALLNLIGNAVKYGADGSWIGVTVARGSGRDDGYVTIAVADRGRGIPAEDLAHIFKPFYRGAYARERQIHGNGLGLSLVKRIADANDGRISVKSEPGSGTTFTLTLPVSKPQPARLRSSSFGEAGSGEVDPAPGSSS